MWLKENLRVISKLAITTVFCVRPEHSKMYHDLYKSGRLLEYVLYFRNDKSVAHKYTFEFIVENECDEYCLLECDAV
jgi:hypothetical protein